MQPRQIAVILGVVGALAGPAQAGLFGGFAKGGDEVVRGTDKVCSAVSDKMDLPKCRSVSSSELAALKIDKGARQQGGSAKFEARAVGTLIEVVAAGGEVARQWDAGGAVHSIDGVYLSARGREVAVEYTTRFGGRSVSEVVAIRLPAAKPGARPASDGAPDSSPKPPPTHSDPPELRKLLDAAARAIRKKKWSTARTQLDRAAAAHGDHAELRFWRAAFAAAQGQTREALAALSELGASSDPRAPVWLVEARRHEAFKALRKDQKFRVAVGLAPGRTLTAYERVVGHGGSWEQAAISCEQPRVNLQLRRDRKQSFDLVFRSACQGMRETTRLDGRWFAKGTDTLGLHFPNQEGPDEVMMCRVERCSDSSGEDCVRCNPDLDLEILLRIVRR